MLQAPLLEFALKGMMDNDFSEELENSRRTFQLVGVVC